MEEKKLKFRDYFKIALLFGIVYATIPIIVTEITWDGIANIIGLSGLLRELIGSFLRAALLEESFKFYGFMKANDRYKFNSEAEFMLGAGSIGLAYGFVEKFVTGNLIAIILGILFPMHILWQMNQGRHFYKYTVAKDNNDKKKSNHELFMSTIFVFLIHGFWDAIISLGEYFIDDTNKFMYAETLGTILIIAIILFGIIYMVISIKKFIHVLKNN